MNNINISDSVNAPSGEILPNSNQNTVNIGQSIKTTLNSINYLLQETQNIPENKRKTATIYLEDLIKEVEKAEQSDPERIKAYWLAFSGVFLPYLENMNNITEVFKVIKNLDNQLKIELPILEEITNRSQLTEEQVLVLANEIDQTVWSRLKAKFIK